MTSQLVRILKISAAISLISITGAGIGYLTSNSKVETISQTEKQEIKVATKANTKQVAKDIPSACQKLKGVVGWDSLSQEQCKEKLREREEAKAKQKEDLFWITLTIQK